MLLGAGNISSFPNLDACHTFLLLASEPVFQKKTKAFKQSCSILYLLGLHPEGLKIQIYVVTQYMNSGEEKHNGNKPLQK